MIPDTFLRLGRGSVSGARGMTPDLRAAARALGGEVSGGQVLCPGPGHSPKDRSLSVKFSPDAPDGFVVNSFSTDGFGNCRDYVREKLGLPAAKGEARKFEVESYRYENQLGVLQYETVRCNFRFLDGSIELDGGKPRKKFLARRQGEHGEWTYKVKGFTDPIPYKLPQLLNAIRYLRRIFLVEGERKADKLRALGLEATCNPFGCKWEWSDEFVEHFRGAEIIILPDHDEPGRAWGAKCVRLLTGVAVSVTIVALDLTGEGDDVVDWLDAGHTAEELLALVGAPATPTPTHYAYHEERVWSAPRIEEVTDPAEITAIRAEVEGVDARDTEPQSEEPRAEAKPSVPTTIKSTTWVWRDPADIERRKWLYGTHYIRGSVTATVGRRGGGKTNRAIGEAISMVSGRDLLKTGGMPDGQLRVWYIGEDSREEIEMRIVAACALYGIKPEEIGDRLAFDSIYDFPSGALKLASLQGTKAVPNLTAIAAIKADMIAKQIDVLILDPLKKFHGLREGDQEMDELMTILSDIAKEAKVAIEILHHTRKQAAGAAATPITADDARGADAIIAGPRDVRLVNAMSTREATDFGIPSTEAWRYSRIDDGKQNLKPPGKAAWTRSASQLLPCGESVGVLQPWTPPKLFDGITNKDMATARELAKTGQYRADVRSSNWFGYILGKRLGFDPSNNPTDKVKLNGMIKIWIKNKVLGTEERNDVKGNSRVFIIPGSNIAQEPSFDDDGGSIE